MNYDVGIVKRRTIVGPSESFFSYPGAVAATFNTYNPSDKQANITLSGGNLTATNSAASAWDSVRSVKSASSGKYYWEDTLNTSPSGEIIIDGFANATFGLTTILGFDANGVGYDPATGDIILNGSRTAFLTAGVNDTVAYAVDFGAQLFWVKRVASVPSNWNNNASADPATGSLGFSFSTMNAGPYFATACLFQPGSVTTNFGATSYIGTPPTGYGNW